MKRPSISIYQDKRRAVKNGGYPVKLRITHERQTRLFDLGLDMSEKDFTKISTGKYLTEELEKKEKKIEEEKKRANTIIDEMEFFTFDNFKTIFTGKGDRNNLLFRFDQRIEANEVKSPGTARIDRDSKSSIVRYLAKKKAKTDTLQMASINPKWLKDFQAYEEARGISSTTIFINMARIKAIFNEAIQNGEFDAKKYPFGKGKYKMPTPNKSKRALNENQLIALLSYTPKTDQEQYAKDFWVFSFLASGMNLSDVFSLKRSNFKNDSFSFFRKKTAKKTKDPVQITVYLRPEMIEIIERYKSKTLLFEGENDYIFDVISPTMTPGEIHLALKVAINKVNLYLKDIGRALGFDFELTSYYARHTYATRLMKTAPLAYISKQLGHSNISTTENYLGQFQEEEARKYESDLIPKFKLG